MKQPLKIPVLALALILSLGVLVPAALNAFTDDAFVAEIGLFAGNFAPRGWAFCNGQILPISQNTALFSLLGTTYGGDGRRTFALPNLNGAVVLGAGQGPGLSLYDLGEMGGSNSIALDSTQLASHAHGLSYTPSVGARADVSAPLGNVLLATACDDEGNEVKLYAVTPDTSIAAGQTLSVGGNQPFDIRPPYLQVTYIIALQGVFPPR